MTEDSLPDVHQALRLARLGQMSSDEMLNHLFAGLVCVPMPEPPSFDGGVVSSWQPATLTRSDGSQWLAAFTTPVLAAAFCKQNPPNTYFAKMETRWILQTLPPDIGIVLNLNSEDMLEWSAQGIDAYRKQVLGW